MKLTCLFSLFFTLIALISSAVNFSLFTGLTLNMQTGKKVDCADITATTAKADMKVAGFSCTSTTLVDGIEFSNYKTKDCSDAASTIPIKSGECMVTDKTSVKMTCATDMITLSGYTDAKCATVDATKSRTFKSGDGKCHADQTATPAPVPALSAPAPSGELGDASTNALATGFAVAGIIVSLVLM